VSWFLAVVALTIGPWMGGNLRTASSSVMKYRLDVAGKPYAVVHLRTSGVREGWIAAFCTPKACAPTSVEAVLPASGHAVFQFELIREAESAAKTPGAVTIDAEGTTLHL